MNTPQNIVFSCPHCRVQLSVPTSLAGVTGPCPQCSNTISAPHPQAFPGAIIPPSASSYAQPVSAPAPITSDQPQPAAAYPSNQSVSSSPTSAYIGGHIPIRPEPRSTPAKPHPSTLVPEEKPVVLRPQVGIEMSSSRHASAVTGSSNSIGQRREKSNFPLARLIIPLVLMVVLGAGFFVLWNFLNGRGSSNDITKQSSSDAKTELHTDTETETPTVKEGDVENTLEGGETDPDETSKTAIRTTAPDRPIVEDSDPAPSSSHNMGLAVSEMITNFLKAKDFATRKPFIYSKKSDAELSESFLNKPWPAAQITPGSQTPHPAERLVEFYYQVSFGDNGSGFPKDATLLVHQRGNEEPKIILDPILDTIGGRLREYAKTPSKTPQDFYCILDAREKCYNNEVPNSAKKSTFYLRAHGVGEDIAVAYVNEQSPVRKAFDNPLDGLKWKDPIPVVLTLQWNTSEDDNRPFLEVLEIKSKNWNP